MQGPAEAPGVIPHALTEVFQTAARSAAKSGGRRFEFKLSYVELYNEDLLDLMAAEDPYGRASPGVFFSLTYVSLRIEAA
jgi:hypothetical protein